MMSDFSVLLEIQNIQKNYSGNGHIEIRHFVLYREVLVSSEVSMY